MKDVKRNKKDHCENKLKIPDYVYLREKYECSKCKYYYKSQCNGDPDSRTQCEKKTRFVSTVFSLVTTFIIVIIYILIYSYLEEVFLSLAYTIIAAVGMDVICYLLESSIDKIFRKIEKARRKRYDEKVANIKAINKEKKREAERQKEKEALVYKDINDAKELFSRLNELKERAEIKEELLDVYKNFLSNIENLLEQINLTNFYFSEIKRFFQFHLPKLEEYILVYIEKVENKKATEMELGEIIKLVETFNIQTINIRNNLNNSNAESFVYKMQALREVVSYKEDT